MRLPPVPIPTKLQVRGKKFRPQKKEEKLNLRNNFLKIRVGIKEGQDLSQKKPLRVQS